MRWRIRNEMGFQELRRTGGGGIEDAEISQSR